MCRSCVAERDKIRYQDPEVRKQKLQKSSERYHTPEVRTKVLEEMKTKRQEDPAWKERENSRSKEWRKQNPERVKTFNDKNRAENGDELRKYDNERSFKAKEEAIRYYSDGTMACVNPYNIHKVPFRYIYALSLDFIEGGHKRAGFPFGSALYRTLKSRGYPLGWQVLCMNCQHAKSVVNNERHGSQDGEKRKTGWKRKIRVLSKYGGTYPPQCANPYEIHDTPFVDIRSLTLDHVNDDGYIERKERGNNLNYAQLEAAGYPNDPPRQVLCWNCQRLKHAKNLGKDPLRTFFD